MYTKPYGTTDIYSFSMQVRTVDIVSYIEEDEFLEGGSPTTISPESIEEPTTQPVDSASDSVSQRVVSWGLDALDSPRTLDGLYQPPCGLTGNGVDVYVLDTGLVFDNSEFEGRAQYPGCDIIDELHGDQQRGRDCNGHGTGIGALIGGANFGVAPRATIFSIRVLNCNRSGSSVTVAKGLECMLEHHSRRGGRSAVVNLSLFGRKSKLMKRAIDLVMDNGISVVTLSGNFNQYSSYSYWRIRDSCKVAPGSVHGVITVAGSTKQNQAYEYTKMGRCVDLFAPGKAITTTSTIYGICSTSGYCSVSLNGGSVAAPHVTGAIALLLEKCPGIPPWRVKHLLLSKMTVANRLDMTMLRQKDRITTPNLFLHLGPAMCDIQC